MPTFHIHPAWIDTGLRLRERREGNDAHTILSRSSSSGRRSLTKAAPQTPLAESSLRAPRRLDSANLLPTSASQFLRGESPSRHPDSSGPEDSPQRHGGTEEMWRRFTNRPAHGNGQSRSFTLLPGGPGATPHSLASTVGGAKALLFLPPTPLSESSLRAPRRLDSDNLLPASASQCLRGESPSPLRSMLSSHILLPQHRCQNRVCAPRANGILSTSSQPPSLSASVVSPFSLSLGTP